MRTIKIVLSILMVALLAAVEIIPARGQGETNIAVKLTPYQGNPVLAAGNAGEWDGGGIACQSLVYNAGMFHLFYVGYAEDIFNNPLRVGYATSKDGMTWTKSEKNPIPVADTNIAPNGISCLSVLLDGKTWVMYFTASETPDRLKRGVFRATAPEPTGPWTVNPEPVLMPGEPLIDWDGAFSGRSLVVWTVIHNDEGYVLYYMPADTAPSLNRNAWTWNIGLGFGRATSPDGITWAKYDDPSTTEEEYAKSDPVFLMSVDLSKWDSGYIISPLVRHSADGWEMFYAGAQGQALSQVGYAISADGIHWTRVGDGPIFNIENGIGRPSSVVVIDGTYYLYNAVRIKGSSKIEMWLYTGTITRK